MTPQTLTPAELDELAALEAKATPGEWVAWRDGNQYVDVGHSSHVVGASILKPVPRAWNPNGIQQDDPNVTRLSDADADLIVAMRSKLPALLAMARRLGEVTSIIEAERERRKTAKFVSPKMNDCCSGYAVMSADLDSAQEQLTAATARAEALAERVKTLESERFTLGASNDGYRAQLDTADARAQAAEKRCGEMEAKLAECSQGWRRTERGDGDVRLECLTCGTVEYDALPAKPGGVKP